MVVELRREQPEQEQCEQAPTEQHTFAGVAAAEVLQVNITMVVGRTAAAHGVPVCADW